METEHHQLCQARQNLYRSQKRRLLLRNSNILKYGLEVTGQKICCWLGRQTKTGKARKTEKADGSVQRYSYLTTADGQLLYRESAKNTVSRHFGLLQYLSVSSLVEMVYLSAETDSLSESYLFSESYLCLNHIMAERWNSQTSPCWL